MKKTIAATLAIHILCAFCAAFGAQQHRAKANSGEFFVDLSPYANVSAENPSGAAMKPVSFKAGKQTVKGVEFELLDPAKKSVLCASRKVVKIPVSGKVKTPQNLYILANIPDGVDYDDHACAHIILKFENDEENTLWIRKERDFGRSCDSGKPARRAVEVSLEGAKSGGGAVFLGKLFPANAVPLKEIIVSGDVNIFAMTFSDKEVPVLTLENIDFSKWRVVDMSKLEIADGSALDVSAGMGKDPAGRFGRVRIGKSGHFEFEKMPGKPVKFKGTNWRPGYMFGGEVKTHADIDALAKMMRKQGYNLVRWRLSMGKEFEKPYKLKEFNKDLYDYFFYAFAREGVYHHFNLASHDLGAPGFRWERRMDNRVLMYFGDPKVREDWRKLVHYQLNLVNKYTGKKWKDDPSIATTEYFNEIDAAPLALKNITPEARKFVNDKFSAYLEKVYGTVEAFKAARPELKNISSFADVKASETDFKDPDYSRFVLECGRDFQRFCEHVVRDEEGFKAPLHQHNCQPHLVFSVLSAEAGDYSCYNTYHNHPSAFMSKGSRIANDSSIARFGKYYLDAVAKRVADRPMMLSEYQHCYWNEYAYEGGLLIPAYAALQGFDNLTVHDVAIVRKASVMGPFEVGRSPLFRANEFLCYAMFYRGDVATTKNRVNLVIDQDYINKTPYLDYALNVEQIKTALLTGFAIELPKSRETQAVKNIKKTPSVYKMKPEGATAAWTGINIGGYKVSEAEKILRKKGVLGKGNITDTAGGVFQSDTGEITMRAKEKLLKVVTEKTEAIACTADAKNEPLGRATFVSSTTPASFAVVSVDGKPLSTSERMVVIYNTDNLMTGFKATIGRNSLVDIGRMPVMMKAGKLSAKLKLPAPKLPILKRVAAFFKKPAPKSYNLYALKVNGERMAKIPVEVKDGEILINIDTFSMKETTPFFELVRE